MNIDAAQATHNSHFRQLTIREGIAVAAVYVDGRVEIWKLDLEGAS